MASWDAVESIYNKGTQVNIIKDEEKNRNDFSKPENGTSNTYAQVDHTTEFVKQHSSEAMHGTTNVKDCDNVQIGDGNEQYSHLNITGNEVVNNAQQIGNNSIQNITVNYHVHVHTGLGHKTQLQIAQDDGHSEGKDEICDSSNPPKMPKVDEGCTNVVEDSILSLAEGNKEKINKAIQEVIDGLSLKNIKKGSIILTFEDMDEATAAKLKEGFKSGKLPMTIIEQLLPPEQRNEYVGKTLDVTLSLEESQIEVRIAERKGEGQESGCAGVTSSCSASYQGPVDTRPKNRDLLQTMAVK